MTELPPAQAANLGLGPRKFRLRDGPDMSDRSCWTDTPTQKAQKQMDLVNIKNILCISVLNCNVYFICIKILEFYIWANIRGILFRKQKDSENQRKNM